MKVQKKFFMQFQEKKEYKNGGLKGVLEMRSRTRFSIYIALMIMIGRPNSFLSKRIKNVSGN